MPVVGDSSTSVAASFGGGMTNAQIIEQMLKQIDRRDENVQDYYAMLMRRIQKFCLEAPFYWRKKTGTFTSAPTVPEYDLTGSTVECSDFSQMHRVFRYEGDGSRSEIYPMTDLESQMDSMEDTTQDNPTNYFIVPGTWGTLRLTPIPPDAKKYRFIYDAIPNPSMEQMETDNVPLVPGNLHFVLVDGLKMDALENLEGSQTAKFLAAQSAYLQGVEYAKSIDPYINSQSRWVPCDNAVRSTH